MFATQGYQKASINNTKLQHPSWTNETQILAQATADFDAGARAFFEGTLQLVKKLRPKGRFGYYQFPYCAYNGTGCSPQMLAWNDQTQWLWDASDVLYPEIYQPNGTCVMRAIDPLTPVTQPNFHPSGTPTR